MPEDAVVVVVAEVSVLVSLESPVTVVVTDSVAEVSVAEEIEKEAIEASNGKIIVEKSKPEVFLFRNLWFEKHRQKLLCLLAQW